MFQILQRKVKQLIRMGEPEATYISLVPDGANGQPFEVLNASKQVVRPLMVEFDNTYTRASADAWMQERGFTGYGISSVGETDIMAVSSDEELIAQANEAKVNDEADRFKKLTPTAGVTVTMFTFNSPKPAEFKTVGDLLRVAKQGVDNSTQGTKQVTDNFMSWLAYEDASITTIHEALMKGLADGQAIGEYELTSMFMAVVENLCKQRKYNDLAPAAQAYGQLVDGYVKAQMAFLAQNAQLSTSQNAPQTPTPYQNQQVTDAANPKGDDTDMQTVAPEQQPNTTNATTQVDNATTPTQAAAALGNGSTVGAQNVEGISATLPADPPDANNTSDPINLQLQNLLNEQLPSIANQLASLMAARPEFTAMLTASQNSLAERLDGISQRLDVVDALEAKVSAMDKALASRSTVDNFSGFAPNTAKAPAERERVFLTL